MSLTLCQIGACRGEELQDAEIVDFVPGWHVAEYRARCSDCGGAYPLRACWLDTRDRIHCGACLADQVRADLKLQGVVMLGQLHLGPGEMRQVRARLQQCDVCDTWFSGHLAATCCEPCRKRGER